MFESADAHSPLKLIDFGLSTRFKDEGRVRRMKSVVGTAYYVRLALSRPRALPPR